MYLSHFGLERFPFSIAPDPSLLFPSKGHQEALAHLHYALTGHGGLVCLTGEVGTGKTTLCRAFLETAPDNIRTAYLFNPQLNPLELLQALCDELEIPYQDDDQQQALYKKLNAFLLDCYGKGQRVICLVDEAQAMPTPTLEQIRLLTNLETSEEKLMTLILVGQPELRELLLRHEHRQLNQRITARYHLDTLAQSDIEGYLRFRLENAGGPGDVFEQAAAHRIWQGCKGIPRLINSVADRCLLGAFAQSRTQVSEQTAIQAMAEVLATPDSTAQASTQVNSQPSTSSPVMASAGDTGQLHVKRLTRAVWALTVVLVVVIALLLLPGQSTVSQWRQTLAGWIAPQTERADSAALSATVSPDGAIGSAEGQSGSGLSGARLSGLRHGDQLAENDQTAQKTNSIQAAAVSNRQDAITRRLSEKMGLGQLDCAELSQFGWQCLWVQWPLSQLQPLQQQTAVNVSGQWKLFDDGVPQLPGEYPALVIWQPLQEYERAIQPGQRSPVVQWVRRALGIDWHGDWQVVSPDGQAATGLDPQLYDPLLAIEVAKFQVANGLDADRIIGPQTLVYLQRQLYLDQQADEDAGHSPNPDFDANIIADEDNG